MQRLKRVFNIDIETCQRCYGRVKVIACIEDPLIIEKIQTHLKKQEAHAPRTTGVTASRKSPSTIQAFQLRKIQSPKRETMPTTEMAVWRSVFRQGLTEKQVNQRG
tara:strand:- start:242 stop:559 length:318 start_codon:yes stop_codon:yes gene_type:complete